MKKKFILATVLSFAAMGLGISIVFFTAMKPISAESPDGKLKSTEYKMHLLRENSRGNSGSETETTETVTETTETETVDRGCVFKTVFEGEDIDSNFIYNTPVAVEASLKKGTRWLIAAQAENGGWGAGSHYHQEITDPNAVAADPATTALVAMAILRTGSTLTTGVYSVNLKKATNYLLAEVEKSPETSLNITEATGTQPQSKLGQNIDVVLTSQYLTNIVDLQMEQTYHSRVKKCLDKCVSKIQKAQNANGSQGGAGWAGVLQSSFAANALETAKAKGVAVNEESLVKSQTYQWNNYDAKNKKVKTEDAAGVMLYSVSGSTRSTAKDARKAKESIDKAKKDGKLKQNEVVSYDNLKKAGYGDSEAMKYATAYEINSSAKKQAQSDRVMEGFGSNGGEEFLSYLQTGEGLIMSKDIEWKKWYANVSGKLVNIQNENGNWQGHHCITSPVFCTATALLILAVNNDVEKLVALGAK